jgi:predicted Rossmann-fold nucleotide-binding protein
MPGGFGTMDEFFEGLTLIQTGKMKKNMPIILYGSEFWNKVMNLEALVEFGTISRADLDLFQIVDNVDDAYKIIIDGLEEFAVDNPGPLL